MNFINSLILVFLMEVVACVNINAQDIDRTYNVSIHSPTYNNGPRVLFDEEHYNTVNDGSYKPFISLIRNDGYQVDYISDEFSTKTLVGDILVIVNPRGGKYIDKSKPAFSDDECKAVKDWIQKGGSLLLLVDTYHSSAASRNMANYLGIKMGGGTVTDSKNYERSTARRENLIFNRANGLLKDHPITRGRTKEESISNVVSFNGQSLITVSRKSERLLELSATAKEAQPDSTWQSGLGLFKQDYTRFGEPKSVTGLSQGIAFELGKGRVVMLGDITMLTALIVDGDKQGMNLTGNDNKQFALNVIHWLSRKI